MHQDGQWWEPFYCFSNRWFPEITGKDNLCFLTPGEWSPLNGDSSWEELICDSFRSSGMEIIIYTSLPAGGTYCPICIFPTNSECLIGISDAFSAFVYGYPSSCPHAQCTPNKSVTTLRYTRRHGPVYIQAMPVGTFWVQSPGFPKIIYCEHQSQSSDHNIWRDRRAKAESSWSFSAYQVNAIPLHQTSTRLVMK